MKFLQLLRDSLIRDSDARTFLAFGITIMAVIGIITLSMTIIITADEGLTADSAQQVLNTILPLFGTWVGTVLAYYFSRENFDAATESTKRLVRELSPEERLRSVPVLSVMIRRIFALKTSDKVRPAVGELSKNDIKRLPIFDENRVFEALLYREELKDYVRDLDDTADPTIQDLLTQKPELNHEAAFISRIATMEEAQSAMIRLKGSKVIFITENGAKDEVIEGMLTYADIAKHVYI